MANSVTVPGVSGPIVLSSGTGDTLNLARLIGAALNSLGGSLLVTEVSTGSSISSPTVTPGRTNEVLLTTNDINASIPDGYQFVVVTGGGNTLTGANVEILGGTIGGTYSVVGNSTIAATGGNNLLVANSTAGGQFAISTGPGNNTILGYGTGLVADGAGSNLIFVAGNTTVLAAGQDIVVAGAGTTSLVATGSNSLIFGDSPRAAHWSARCRAAIRRSPLPTAMRRSHQQARTCWHSVPRAVVVS